MNNLELLLDLNNQQGGTNKANKMKTLAYGVTAEIQQLNDRVLVYYTQDYNNKRTQWMQTFNTMTEAVAYMEA